jgi:hypothetical protein
VFFSDLAGFRLRDDTAPVAAMLFDADGAPAVTEPALVEFHSDDVSGFGDEGFEVADHTATDP